MIEQIGQYPENVQREIFVTETLETAWSKLPSLLRRLNNKQQFGFRKYFSEKIGVYAFFGQWEKILEKSAQESRKSHDRYNLSYTEGRVDVMTGNKRSNYLYVDLLRELGEFEKSAEDSEDFLLARAGSFLTTLYALRATLPWNITGHNPVKPQSLDYDVAKKAALYIKNL